MQKIKKLFKKILSFYFLFYFHIYTEMHSEISKCLHMTNESFAVRNQVILTFFHMTLTHYKVRNLSIQQDIVLLHPKKVPDFSGELCVNCVLVQFPHLLTQYLSSLKHISLSFYNYQLDLGSSRSIEHKYDAPSPPKLHAKCMPGAVRAAYGP